MSDWWNKQKNDEIKERMSELFYKGMNEWMMK